MADQPALKRAFADYARTIAGRYEIGDVLQRLTDQMVEILGVAGVGVSLGDDEGRLQFVTATDRLVTHAEEGQIGTREGPCHDAFRSGDTVTVTDLETEERWPKFRPIAMEAGMHAIAGIPMLAEGQRVGALDIYSATPREWPADDVTDARLLADMATGYIINARTLTETERRAKQLQHALDSRVVIEQAKGVIAERHRITPSAAFNILRQHSRSNNSKIHDVARAVIDDQLSV